jgi:hypothetical protein
LLQDQGVLLALAALLPLLWAQQVVGQVARWTSLLVPAVSPQVVWFLSPAVKVLRRVVVVFVLPPQMVGR